MRRGRRTPRDTTGFETVLMRNYVRNGATQQGTGTDQLFDMAVSMNNAAWSGRFNAYAAFYEEYRVVATRISFRYMGSTANADLAYTNVGNIDNSIILQKPLLATVVDYSGDTTTTYSWENVSRQSSFKIRGTSVKGWKCGLKMEQDLQTYNSVGGTTTALKVSCPWVNTASNTCMWNGPVVCAKGFLATIPGSPIDWQYVAWDVYQDIWVQFRKKRLASI